MAQGLAQELGGEIVLQRWKHEQTVCTTLALPGAAIPFEPCLATRGDVLLFALSRGALQEALDQCGRDTSILAHPRVAELPEKSFEGLVSFGFSDDPKTIERGFGAMGMLQAALSNALMAQGGLPAGMPSLSALLPSYGALARGARPNVSLTYVRGSDLIQATTHDSSFVARLVAKAGSPMGQANPMALGIVASIAIPKLMEARNTANEAAAIATLRALTSAQAQFQATAAADADGDGNGEYGTLAELAGVRPVRGSNVRLEPPVLTRALGELEEDGCGGGVVSKSGYYYQVWLPAAGGGALGNSHGREIDAELAELRWCAYAWPMDVGATGVRAFYVDQLGDVYATDNFMPDSYTGVCGDGGNQPGYASALESPRDFDSHPPAHGASVDGNVWSVVR
jgi:hypothetical protein